MDDIKKMMDRLSKNLKNPSRFAQITPTQFVKWANKHQLQQILDCYSQLIKEQQTEIEELKKAKEATNGTTQPA